MAPTPSWMHGDAGPAQPPPGIDTDLAHPARIYDYWLGGKDNFAADRTVGDQIIAATPAIVKAARANRAFLGRAVRYLAGEAGIRQFLDIGTGVPTAGNTHTVAQEAAPESRVVYVDNDPVVLAHARALLRSGPHGATAYVDADLRDTDAVLRGAEELLDRTRPTAVMLLGILEFITDDAQVADIVGRLLGAFPSGSHLVVSHSTAVVDPQGMNRAALLWNEGGSTPLVLRGPDDLARVFAGLELVEPGIVSVPLWRPGLAPAGDGGDGAAPAPVDCFAAVGRVP
ncbi:SAM-dependent methyltransferase [Streptomonospora sp. S1-112]|uniref:SAM-dependent methyltransferase n=1 Tax=Streptomonospora mangrovi TaxID=2883123 RepID=A0A9X3NQT6_9ACTN|nr:SAM-dependent methyltransferase [Streptomonospora mangrovi]MDA0567460.1 SAM-dependent methyltransferase [Streptomonospora mangrovi]